jgi:peptidoglycan/xylan/chitin deacetylase (PgdA/CDA1 family)
MLACLPTEAGSLPADLQPSAASQRAAVDRLIAQKARVFCAGDTGDGVALTFDDGPGRFTSAMLDVLRRSGARATFFDLGRRVASYRTLVRREAAQGVVGDHSWSHPVLPLLGMAGISAQLSRAQRVLLLASGQPSISLFRPPYGALDDRVARTATTLNMLPILWSVYSGDTALNDPNSIAELVAAGTRPGSIILLHENNNHGQTITALGPILASLEAKGLRPRTVPELLALDPPTARQLHTGPYGCGPTVTGLEARMGPEAGGTLVKITGDELRPVHEVFFGTRPALSVAAVSQNEVDATSPPGTGAVDVTVTTHFGASPRSTLDVFTYQ